MTPQLTETEKQEVRDAICTIWNSHDNEQSNWQHQGWLLRAFGFSHEDVNTPVDSDAAIHRQQGWRNRDAYEETQQAQAQKV